MMCRLLGALADRIPTVGPEVVYPDSSASSTTASTASVRGYNPANGRERPGRAPATADSDSPMYEDADLVYYPDPVLRKVCEPVAVVDDSIRALAKRMFEVMYANRGVGLAAPQVGVSLRVFVVNTTKSPEGEQVLINPEVLETSGTQTGSEGCLSFPEISLKVTRPNFAKMKALDLQGRPREWEGTELLARAYLHELDHLNGMLLTDKMGALQRLSWRRTLKHLEEDYEEEKRRKSR